MVDEINISRADLSRDEQTALLRSVEQWNAWREAHGGIQPDLISTNLSRADLAEADLAMADLREAILTKADLTMAEMFQTNLTRVDLAGAYLSGANLTEANLAGADLSEADLTGADLVDANLSGARLRQAILSGADLTGADLTKANLRRANLTRANLRRTDLINTSFASATLDSCNVFGISAWKVQLDDAIQNNLRITDLGEPAITVDDLRVAQFLYLLLNNEEIRAVLDTIASKVVLILGRFSSERKPALDALRAALRQHPNGYIPVLFDFDKQQEKPVLDTVKTLANLSRFVVVDLTDPNMVRSELTAITANVPTVPIRPLIEGEAPLPTEVESWAGLRSFLPIYRYRDITQLIDALDEAVIDSVEQYVGPRPVVERPYGV